VNTLSLQFLPYLTRILDFDIENEAPDEDEQSGSEESADEDVGTEHYVAVGYALDISTPAQFDL
jgi:hypothetical protein